MKKYGNEISEGSACILVREDGLEDTGHAFWKWLRNEGFKPWLKHGHYQYCDWVFINLNSMIYAPGMPGVKITSVLRETGFSVDEFRQVWEICKYREKNPVNRSVNTDPFRQAGISPAVPEGAHICHIFGMEDAAEAGKELETEAVKGYGDETRLEDGTFLHLNYECDDGGRALVRCKKCGGLLLVQHSNFEALDSDHDGYYADWLPVWSEEEADLLNLFLEPGDFTDHPFRHLRSNNFRYCWAGEDPPRPMDLPELRNAVAAKYGQKTENRETEHEEEGIALTVPLWGKSLGGEEIERYAGMIRNLRDIPDDFIIFDFENPEGKPQEGLLFCQLCVSHDDVLRIEIKLNTEEGERMYARDGSAEEAVSILCWAVNGGDLLKLDGWENVTERILGKEGDSEIPTEAAEEAVREFVKNPWWNRYYETAPSEKCREYIKMEFLYSLYRFEGAEEAMKKMEEGLSLEDWKHLYAYNGNNPRKGYIAGIIRKLENNETSGK